MAAENPSLWERPQEMQRLNQEKSHLDRSVQEWSQLSQRISDAEVLHEMAIEERDEATFAELQTEVSQLVKAAEELELKRLLNGELDMNNTYLSVNSGAGGTEAADWASMLMRMYLRYGERLGGKVDLIEVTEGEEAGIKSATLLIQAPYAYGYLKSESGVHRLVRISPFDSNARRHTSFASVFVWAEVDDTIEIDLKMEDVKIDTYRAGGAGGQHINKTDSAVRMTHLPSGIVVQCQNQRSQHANKDAALKMLRAALYEREVQERNRQRDAENAQKKANEWGSQIRSYVMHPYKMVKDHRTLHECATVDDVMDGDLDPFVMANLKREASAETSLSGVGE